MTSSPFQVEKHLSRYDTCTRMQQLHEGWTEQKLYMQNMTWNTKGHWHMKQECKPGSPLPHCSQDGNVTNSGRTELWKGTHKTQMWSSISQYRYSHPSIVHHRKYHLEIVILNPPKLPSKSITDPILFRALWESLTLPNGKTGPVLRQLRHLWLQSMKFTIKFTSCMFERKQKQSEQLLNSVWCFLFQNTNCFETWRHAGSYFSIINVRFGRTLKHFRS